MEVIFNPSMPYRLTHMLLASGLTAAFLIAGLSAFRLLRHDRSAAVMKTLKTGAYLAAVLIPLQIFAGHEHGLVTREHQPAKLAAMEGAWETDGVRRWFCLRCPDESRRTNDFTLEIPYLASLIVTHSMDGEIRGLNEFETHPPVAPVFFAFRLMVGIGMLMFAASWLSSYLLLRHGKLPDYCLRALAA